MSARRKRHPLKIFAHRGASATHPENTMLAFYEAERAGADGIELDVQRTRDGQVVVVHDENLERLTGWPLWVKDLTWKGLRDLNVAAPFPAFGPQRAPLLGDVLDWLRSTDLEINIELKNSVIPIAHFEEDVLRVIDAHRLRPRVIISSFSLESAVRMKKLAPDIHCAFLSTRPTHDDLRRAKEGNLDAIHPHILNVWRPWFPILMRRYGFVVRYWTLESKWQLRAARWRKAAAIIVNDPAGFRRHLPSAPR